MSSSAVFFIGHDYSDYCIYIATYIMMVHCSNGESGRLLLTTESAKHDTEHVNTGCISAWSNYNRPILNIQASQKAHIPVPFYDDIII